MLNHSQTGTYALLQSSIGDTFLNATASKAIYFRINNAEGMILDANRNVGVGTTVPAAKLQVSGTVNVVNFRGSGSATTQSIFTVDGAAGRLFSVNDSLSGSLFSVNTIAGLPVIEAFSDNTVRIGQFGQRALFVSQSRVGINKETLLNANLDISGSVIITGSLIIISGSSREFQVTNIGVNIGNIVTDTHTLTGSFNVSGSIISNGNTTITGSFTVISGSSREFQVTDIGVNIGNIVTDTHTITGSFNISGSTTGIAEHMILAVSDETTALTTGNAKLTFRAPFAMTLTQIPRSSVSQSSSSGLVTVDINEAGTSILGVNKLSIDATEKTSVTAATPTTLADTSIADDAEITLDIDAAGTGAKGLKVTLYYVKV